MNFILRIGFLWFTGFNERILFYYAWTFSDLICNASGLGFNGYEKDGVTPKWDQITNLKIFNIEVC